MNLSSARILIVDDDPLMLALVADTLRQIGIRNVQKCPDGKAGLTAVVKFQPHLILSDIHMAPMSGLEFVKKLRAIPDRAVAATRVIFMTADASKETLGEALPLGIRGYIIKPPTVEQVGAKLKAALA